MNHRATCTIDSTFHRIHAGGEGQTLFVELSKRFPQRAEDVQSLTIGARSPQRLQALLEELIDDLLTMEGYAHLVIKEVMRYRLKFTFLFSLVRLF